MEHSIIIYRPSNPYSETQLKKCHFNNQVNTLQACIVIVSTVTRECRKFRCKSWNSRWKCCITNVSSAPCPQCSTDKWLEIGSRNSNRFCKWYPHKKDEHRTKVKKCAIQWKKKNKQTRGNRRKRWSINYERYSPFLLLKRLRRIRCFDFRCANTTMTDE